MTGAWHQGYEAYPDLDPVDNPYPSLSVQHMDWAEGWEAACDYEAMQEERKRS